MSKALTNLEESTLMRACDGNATWKLSTLRSLYVLSSNTPEEFAARFNLNVAALNRAITDGRWETLREEYRAGNMEPLREATRQRLQAMYVNTVNQLELLEFQENQQLEQLQRHRAQFGDLYLHDEVTGDVKKDVFGQPITIPLIQSPGREKMKSQIIANLQGCVVSLKMLSELESKKNPQADPTLLEASRQKNDEIDEEIFGKRCEKCGERCGGKCGA